MFPMPSLPILEHDAAREALIEPARIVRARDDMPAACVLCFFHDVIEHLRAAGELREVTRLHSEMGDHPVYRLAVAGGEVALLHPGIGAPLAAGLMEEAIALGGKAFVACGGAGVLDPGIAVGTVLVPTAAVRDEGTSYHYQPPARVIELDLGAVTTLERVLQATAVPYRRVRTWTTDAIYRETPARIAARRGEGCACVEMEAAALCAVARFRGVRFGQLLYGGDDVSGATWDSRGWLGHWGVREALTHLAAECAQRL